MVRGKAVVSHALLLNWIPRAYGLLKYMELLELLQPGRTIADTKLYDIALTNSCSVLDRRI